jgi:mannose-6-phosphate isomerase-like protein (cupin superfamily)
MSQNKEKNPVNILKQAIQNRSVKIFPKYYSNFPDKWDYFINFIDYGSKQPVPKERQETKEQEEGYGAFRKGLIAFWSYMTIIADRPPLNIFPGLEAIKSDLVSVFEKDPIGSVAFISLSSTEKKLERHDDETDNIYIQCVGSVTWRIYVADSEEYTDHLLEPGDMIFVPMGASHEVFPNSPRCAIAFAFDANS